jgi:hypothetical protein
VRNSVLTSNFQVVNITGANGSLTSVGSTILVPEVGMQGLLVQNASASTTLQNTAVVRHPANVSLQPDLEATTGTITASDSFFNSSGGAGSVPAPGSGTNLMGDPGLADIAGGDLSPLASSQLIDAGDPTLVTAGELDLAGSARSLDGNLDCAAAPDIGAFEFTGGVCETQQPPPPDDTTPNVAPALSAVSLTNRRFAPVGVRPKGTAKRGTTFRYTLSEPAMVTITIERQLPGRRVGGRCRKVTRNNRAKRKCKRFKRVGALSADEQDGAQSTAFSGRLRGKPLKRGGYRAGVVATDPQGLTSAERRVSFTVVKP